jgi:DAK2 domain fusion protein YloV
LTELERVQELARAALANLERNRERIDDLNVYPVPDGDTGTNLTLTLRSLVETMDASTAADRGAIARELTRAALMGARGNSGVIFSQIVRGAAESLGSEGAIEPAVVARALRSASDAAYRAVRRPVEGTMLTVIRELAEAAEKGAPSARTMIALLSELVGSGEDSVRRTPDQLAVLREAGVVDAGGAGLVEILRGLAACAAGEPVPEQALKRVELTVDAIHQELSRFRYCTVFLVEGERLDADALERELEVLGDSLLVVGDETALKVHVHTDDPGAALRIGTSVGVLESVEIANMHRQTEQREERLLEAVPDEVDTACAVVAVVAGEGNRGLFESLGAARVIEGGQTMNPAVAELVAAVESQRHDVLLLPNNPNVVMAAEQAVSAARAAALVVPTRSIQEGLAAMVVFDALRGAEENAAEMREAIAALATGEVTVASRDVELNGLAIHKGNYFGLACGDPVAESESFEVVARAVVERLLTEPREVLTLLTGEDAPEMNGLLSAIRDDHPGLAVDVQVGGQPHYPLLLSAE